MPLSRPRWPLHRPGAGPGGGFRDEDAASSAARPPQAGALTTCRAAGSASRKRVPGAADQAGATATGLCRRPPRPPRPLWSAGLHAAARGFWTAAGTPRNAEKRDSPCGTPPAPSPTPRPRRKRQSREHHSAGTCHHVSSFCRGRNREEPGGARRGEPAKAPPPPPRWAKRVAALEWATVRERLTYRTCHMPNAP